MAGKLKKMRKPEEKQQEMDAELELEFEAPEDEMELDLAAEGEEIPEDEMEAEMADAGEDPMSLADKLEEMGFDVSDLRAQIEEEKPEGDDEEDMNPAEPVPMWARADKPRTV